MNILIINLPFSGHVNPTLNLAKELIEKGHKVTYLITPQWKKKVEKTGASFHPYDCINPNTKWEEEYEIMSIIYNSAKSIAKDFDLIIYEMLFSFGKQLADEFKIPCVRLFSTFAINEYVWNRFISLGGVKLYPFRFKLFRRIATKRITKGISGSNKDMFDELLNSNPDLNIVYTTKDFQIYSDTFSNEKYKFVGPAISKKYDNNELDLSLINRPIIYISMGTLLNNCLELYKLCIEIFRDKNVFVVMSVGDKIDINRIEDIPSNFIIRNYVNQINVLKYASVFISHGGMNSVNEAIYHGVPLLILEGAAKKFNSKEKVKSIIPMALDQPAISSRVVELNCGKCLKDNINSENIYKETFSILGDSSIKKSINKIKDKMEETTNNKEAAYIIDKLFSRE